MNISLTIRPTEKEIEKAVNTRPAPYREEVPYKSSVIHDFGFLILYNAFLKRKVS